MTYSPTNDVHVTLTISSPRLAAFTSPFSIVIFVSLTLHISYFPSTLLFPAQNTSACPSFRRRTITVMVPTKDFSQLLSLPAIHAHWTAALSLPPTAQLSSLRRLVRAIIRDHHPALRPLSIAALCPLYLDLALAYAFLGEYYLASQVFKEAVDNDATSAVGWFGLGLAQAELSEWRNARRSWQACLQCFESVDGQQERIRYVLFQAQDELAQDDAAQMLEVGLEVGLNSGEWTLERTRVEFNFRVALGEKGSKKLGVAPRSAGQRRPGLNGLSAGLRFGPGWDASLQCLVSPLLGQYSCSHTREPGDGAGFTSNLQPAVQTPPSSSTSGPGFTLPPRVSSRKPLPALPLSPPTSIPSLTDDGSFNDHRPSLEEDPFTSSSEEQAADPFSTSLYTLSRCPYDEDHERFSRQPTLCTPEDPYFYDHSDSGNDECRDTSSMIDDTIVSWSGLGQIQDEEENVGNEAREDPLQNDSELDGEILQPRVFEGFGPPNKER